MYSSIAYIVGQKTIWGESPRSLSPLRETIYTSTESTCIETTWYRNEQSPCMMRSI